MLIAQVIGTVVSTQKEPAMEGLRLLVCQPVNAECGMGFQSARSIIVVWASSPFDRATLLRAGVPQSEPACPHAGSAPEPLMRESLLS